MEKKIEWTKVTPETMPPKDRAILIAINKDGDVATGMFPAVWHDGEFMGVTLAQDGICVELHRVLGKVTRWAYWPDPPDND